MWTLEGERVRQQETDARGPMATTDDALSGGEAPYSPASRAQDGPRAQQPTDAELDATGAQRPYARTATGIGDRPFRTDDTSGLDPDQMRAAEDRARAQADDARRVTVEDLERQWAERSEEHTSELQSLMRISYAVFCLKKKNSTNTA